MPTGQRRLSGSETLNPKRPIWLISISACSPSWNGPIPW